MIDIIHVSDAETQVDEVSDNTYDVGRIENATLEHHNFRNFPILNSVQGQIIYSFSGRNEYFTVFRVHNGLCQAVPDQFEAPILFQIQDVRRKGSRVFPNHQLDIVNGLDFDRHDPKRFDSNSGRRTNPLADFSQHLTGLGINDGLIGVLTNDPLCKREFLVQLVPTYGTKIVPCGIEEQTVNQLPSIVLNERLTWSELLVDCVQSFEAVGRLINLQRLLDGFRFIKQLENIFVTLIA